MVSSSLYRAFRQTAGVCQRRSRNKKGQKATRPTGFSNHAFLNYQFTPLVSGDLLIGWKNKQETFLQSLRHLCNCYQWPLPDISQHVFPYNVYVCYQYAKEKLQQGEYGAWPVLLEEGHTLMIGTMATADTGMTLFHVPVLPLYNYWRSCRNKKARRLLVSVFAWLHLSVGMPHYRDNGCHVNYLYAIIEESWQMNNADSDDEEVKEAYKEIMGELQAATTIGNSISHLIRDNRHLDALAKRLYLFKPVTDEEKHLHAIASSACALYHKYGRRDIFNCLTEHDDDETFICMDQYFSFCYDTRSILAAELEQYIESDYQQCGYIQEPCAIQYFNTPQEKPCHDISFETAVFDWLDELCTFLNDLS